MGIQPNELAGAIENILTGYGKRITARIKANVDQTAKETAKVVKGHVTFKGSGDYVRAFRVKTIHEDAFSKVKAWYVKDPHYRLTHLLENGHKKAAGVYQIKKGRRRGVRMVFRKGGRVRGYPHVRYGVEYRQKRLRELARRSIEEG